MFRKFKETHARNSPEKKPREPIEKPPVHTKVVRRLHTKQPEVLAPILDEESEASCKAPPSLTIPRSRDFLDVPQTPALPIQSPYSPCPSKTFKSQGRASAAKKASMNHVSAQMATLEIFTPITTSEPYCSEEHSSLGFDDIEL